MIRIFKILKFNCFPSIQAYISCGLLLFLLLTTVTFSSQINDGLIVFKEIWYLMGSGLVLVYFLFSGNCETHLTFKINLADILVFIYFGYSLINSIAKMESIFLTFQTSILLISLMLTYFTIKKLVDVNSLTKHGISFVFYIITFLQITFGFLQLKNYIPSNHNAFLVTGGFFNPAPYAIYLSSLTAFLVPIFLYFLKKREKFLMVLTLILLLSCILLIAICYSRAAWIGLFFSLLFIFFCFFGCGILKLWKSLRYKIIWITALFVLALSIAFWLYSIKENSALGRLLIWKVSFIIFQKNPISGIGSGVFGVHYINFQHDLFQKAAVLSFYKNLAGDVRFAFNDFLQIICENGIIGLILFCTILFLTFYKTNLLKYEFNLSNIIDLSVLGSLMVQGFRF